jgi:ankyrin repeat protein
VKNIYADLLTAFELHSVEQIRSILNTGFDVRAKVNELAPVTALLEMYSRSDRFPDCLRLLLKHGAELNDPKIGPVLLDDPAALEAAVKKDRSLLAHRTSMRCTFTPLVGASLLHVAAEYGHLKTARKLLELGAEVDAPAAIDESGLNGHTALFHTVNSPGNRSEPLMRLLLEAGARPDIFLPGITWGRGFEWETTCFDVTPVAYAQFGLLRQMQRTEADCYANIRTLLKAAGRKIPPLENIPNRYLKNA